MENLSTTESLILGALVLLVLFWMGPGVKASLERSKNAEADWKAVLLPLGFVVLFVLFLIAMV
ncbi:MAG: hypothetical protein CVV06_14640 [Gammaproteobacteria bacterium HGW-Gammaproteobacteria-10]|nr:MAG: hypothetical protein CVV06_14640 [Gammaproteobacteria bacterium HGW-Gammaproteobacteria-10]